ncbi:cytochrome c [Rufibacter psychrotolerans]|uniref:cytochrome c n=1 Tax=Rufibacter psychrotolerans TaxID=2812556 RepID=UPI001967723C|nr:cytochrome c [Rufibacter sp. SYSU D00308]
MKKNLRSGLLGLTLLLTGLSACKDDKEEEITPNNPNQQPQQCDTNSVTYSGTVSGIISSNCLACHNATQANGGMILDTYARVKQVADNGKLMGVITHASGFPAMPQGGPKLSDCNIAKIKKWVDAGAPNN